MIDFFFNVSLLGIVALTKALLYIKEWLANTNINTIDSSNIVSYGCCNCGRNCIDCKYLKEKGEYFYSYVTMRRYKVRQNVNCVSKNVIYLVTCEKCNLASKIKIIPRNIDKHFFGETNQ